MATQLEAGDVVLTHHLPTPKSVPPRFARAAINAFFVSDMTSYLRELRPKGDWQSNARPSIPTSAVRWVRMLRRLATYSGSTP